MAQKLPRRTHPDAHLYPEWSHPDVLYWAPIWCSIRDCLLGSQEIKSKQEFYLPRLEEMDDNEYIAYLDRAVFYNMLTRTVEALSGTIFQRDPKVQDIDQRWLDALNDGDSTAEGISFAEFLVQIAEALIQMGRFGVLLDRDADGNRAPFFRGYDTENILDWQVEKVDGRDTVVQIVLREFEEVTTRRVGERRDWRVVTRVLSLDIEDGKRIYRQYIYEADGLTADLSQITPEVVTPTMRGRPFDFIPFQFFGAKLNTPTVSRPPMADICDLNLAHYKAYAHLEHGRFYTAMPIWYVAVNPTSQQRPEYKLGSSMVWEVAQGEKPGIIEFNGNGLKFLETSLQDKETQIAMIGGRFVAGAARSISESDEQASLNEKNERSLLLRLVKNINSGATRLVNWWLEWQDVREPKAEVELNTAFIFDQFGARELRAAHAMYAEGIIPVTALHLYLQKAEVVPDWMDIEEFKKLLSLVDEFPNQPDVWAKMDGFNTKADQTNAELENRSLDIEDEVAQADKQNATARLKLDRDKMTKESKMPSPVATARTISSRTQT